NGSFGIKSLILQSRRLASSFKLSYEYMLAEGMPFNSQISDWDLSAKGDFPVNDWGILLRYKRWKPRIYSKFDTEYPLPNSAMSRLDKAASCRELLVLVNFVLISLPVFS